MGLLYKQNRNLPPEKDSNDWFQVSVSLKWNESYSVQITLLPPCASFCSQTTQPYEEKTLCKWQQNEPTAYFDHTSAPGKERLWGVSSGSSSLPCPLSIAFGIPLWKLRSAFAFWKAKSWGLASQISGLTRPFFSAFASRNGKTVTPTRSSLLSFSNNIWNLFAPLRSFEAVLLKHVVWSSLFFCEP